MLFQRCVDGGEDRVLGELEIDAAAGPREIGWMDWWIGGFMGGLVMGTTFHIV
jgi:hypothetical protein